MGSVESTTANPAILTDSPRQSPLRQQPEEASCTSRQHVRQVSTLNNNCTKNDSFLATFTLRHPRQANSARSCSENRKMKRNLLESNLEALSLSCSNLRRALQPNIEISGDLTAAQNSAIRRLWKQEMRRRGDNESELATRLLLRVFAIDSRLQAFFHLSNVSYFELRMNELFILHVKAVESTLSFVMLHLHNPTAMSKALQGLGARHVIHTTIQYKSNYWKIVNQAFVEFLNADQTSIDVFDAWDVLGNFCVEQMRIGYKIEYKAQKVLERLRMKNATN